MGAGDVVTSRLSNGRAGITKVLQMDISMGMLQRDEAKAQVPAQFMLVFGVAGASGPTDMWRACLSIETTIIQFDFKAVS